MIFTVNKPTDNVDGQGVLPNTLQSEISLNFYKNGSIKITEGIVFNDNIKLSNRYYNFILDAIQYLRSFEKGYICPSCNVLRRDPQEIYNAIFKNQGLCYECLDKELKNDFDLHTYYS